MGKYKEIEEKLKAEVVYLYFSNLNKPFNWVVDKMSGRLSYYLCDRIIQDYLKNNKEFYITLESKINKL